MPHHPRQKQPKYASWWTPCRIDRRSATKKVDVTKLIACIIKGLGTLASTYANISHCGNARSAVCTFMPGTNWMVFVSILSRKHIFPQTETNYPCDPHTDSYLLPMATSVLGAENPVTASYLDRNNFLLLSRHVQYYSHSDVILATLNSISPPPIPKDSNMQNSRSCESSRLGTQEARRISVDLCATYPY